MFSSLFRKKLPRCSAVIVAAGTAQRMGGIDKVMADLCGRPLLWHTLQTFQKHPLVSEMIVVTREDLLVSVGELCEKSGFSKVKMVLCGGEDRLHSVLNGVACVAKKAHLIAVHDGARPLVSPKIITDTVMKAYSKGAAAPAVPVKDTVKVAKNDAVVSTPERKNLFAVQTPQVFDSDLLRAALYNAQEKNLPVTDDCSCVEAIGMRVFLTSGEEKNLKVTTPLDLKIAKLLMEGESL